MAGGPTVKGFALENMEPGRMSFQNSLVPGDR
jgi:hypothetical protein